MTSSSFQTLVLCATIMILGACSTTKATEDTQPNALRPAVGQAKLLETYARWLPSDSVAVAVIDVRPVLDIYFASFTSGTQDKARAKARLKTLRAELSALSQSRFGMDITRARHIIIGAGLTWQSVIVTGIKSTVPVLKSTRVDGYEVFQLQSSHAEDQGWGPLPIYGLKLRDDAVVFSDKAGLFEGLVKVKSLSLADNKPQYNKLKAIMPKNATRLSGALLLDNTPVQRFLFDDDMPKDTPDAMAISIGDMLTLSFFGDDARLRNIRQDLLKAYNKAFKEFQEGYKKHQEQNTAQAMINVSMFHMINNFRDMLSPEIKNGQMHYRTTALLDPQTGVSGVSMAVLVSIAIPAFVRAIKRSKASEVDGIFKTMRDTARARVLSSDRQDGTRCTDVLSAAPATPLPVGGEKVEADFSDEAWAIYGLKGKQPLYFSYEVVAKEGGVFAFVARADFTEGEPYHTQIMTITVGEDEQGICTFSADPSVTFDAYE